MKKLIILISTLVALAGCGKVVYPDFFVSGNEEFSHDNVEITSMILLSTVDGITSSIEGTIDQEAGTILFVVPRAEKAKFDLTNVRLTATIFYDAEISPKLGGRLWDVTSDEEGNPRINLTVSSQMTGKTKEYTVRGYVSSK